MAVLDMAVKIDWAVNVFTIDTGRLPAATYDLMDEIKDRFGVGLEIIYPDADEISELVSEHGINLMYKSTDLRLSCCEIRKVRPLNRRLRSLDAWITGLRRDQNSARADVAEVELDEQHGGIVKINPLARWTHEQVLEHIEKYNVPRNSLYRKGYTSIGCDPAPGRSSPARTCAPAAGGGSRATPSAASITPPWSTTTATAASSPPAPTRPPKRPPTHEPDGGARMSEGNGQHPETGGTLAESEEDALLQDSPLEIPRPKRAQGQWGLGYLEPLTPQESNKRNQDGLDVYERIIHQYARGLGFDRPGRPQRPLPLVRPLHPAPRGRQDVHDADSHPRGPAHRGAAGRLRRAGAALGQGRDRRHRPPELPVPQPPHRGHPRGLGDDLGGRSLHPADVRRRHPQRARLPDRGRRRRRVHRRHALRAGGGSPADRDQGVLQPAAQVQDLDHRLRRPLRPRGRQRHRRGGPPRRRPGRLRRDGRRRAVDHAAHGPVAGRVRGAGRAGGDVRRHHLAVPRLRLPAHPQPRPAQVPGGRLGHSRSSARCWRRSTSSAAWSTARRRRPPTPRIATTPASTARPTATCTWASRWWRGAPTPTS